MEIAEGYIIYVLYPVSSADTTIVQYGIFLHAIYQVRRLEEAAVHNDEEMLSIEEKRWAAMK